MFNFDGYTKLNENLEMCTFTDDFKEGDLT